MSGNESVCRYAAAWLLCTLRQEETAIPERLLVVDLDSFHAGLCRCTEAGEITVEEECAAVGRAGFFAAAAKQSGMAESVCVAQWTQQEARIRRSLTNYLRAGIDRTAFAPESAAPLSCSAVLAQFEADAAQIQTLLTQIVTLLERQNLSAEELPVLLTGHMAKVFPAEAAVRERLYGSALLPGGCLAARREGVDPADYAALGQALYENHQVERQRTFGHRVELVVLHRNADGQCQEQYRLLAEESDPVTPGRMAELYIAGELTLRIDGQRHTLSLYKERSYPAPYLITLESSENGPHLRLVDIRRDLVVGQYPLQELLEGEKA